ncbi:hypothetical protein L6452_06279 [Arctium lappa]|uniref:Uncharacterized protein n=1 Tax=Arctium lappa TaxID=4217 RepID=A0ACB9EI36_ARCLA|nr:hypothetical protein L6452_06279 [Arctium lappa]
MWVFITVVGLHNHLVGLHLDLTLLVVVLCLHLYLTLLVVALAVMVAPTMAVSVSGEGVGGGGSGSSIDGGGSDAVESLSTMEETPNWLEMPHAIIGMILQRLGALEILQFAQKVYTTWRRICKDPAMWKVIEINHCFHASDKDAVIEKLSKHAVHRSCGELIDISLNRFCTDDLLDYISLW